MRRPTTAREGRLTLPGRRSVSGHLRCLAAVWVTCATPPVTFKAPSRREIAFHPKALKDRPNVHGLEDHVLSFPLETPGRPTTRARLGRLDYRDLSACVTDDDPEVVGTFPDESVGVDQRPAGSAAEHIGSVWVAVADHLRPLQGGQPRRVPGRKGEGVLVVGPVSRPQSARIAKRSDALL